MEKSLGRKGKLKSFVFGEGEKPLIIIPGISLNSVLNSKESIEKAYAIFAKEYTVYVFDRTESVKDGDTVEKMADDIAGEMKSIGLKKTYVLGMSQGGMIAQALSYKYRKLVKKKALCSTTYKCNKKSKLVFEKWIAVAQKNDIEKLNETVYNDIYCENTLHSNENLFEFTKKVGNVDDIPQFIACCKACIKFNGKEYLYKIRKNTLVMGSEGDKVFGKKASLKLGRKLGVKRIIYKEYGHAVYDEAKDFKEKVKEFFDD